MSNLLDRVLLELELDAFGLHESDLLLDQVEFGLGEDLVKTLFIEGRELNTNGKTSLKFCEQIGRFGLDIDD